MTEENAAACPSGCIRDNCARVIARVSFVVDVIIILFTITIIILIHSPGGGGHRQDGGTLGSCCVRELSTRLVYFFLLQQ